MDQDFKKRRIGAIVGSDSDLKQCIEGIEFMLNKHLYSRVELGWFDTLSQHHNTLELQGILTAYSKMPADQKVDVLIVGAGWANHLSGCTDAFLRRTLGDSHITIIAVAFEDKADPEHTKAAVYSIKYVPGLKAIFKNYVGAEGFLQACKDALEIELPKIELPIVKSSARRTWLEARVEDKRLLEIDEQKKLAAAC